MPLLKPPSHKPLQLWLKPLWVNVVLAIVAQPDLRVKLVVTDVTALMVCLANLEIVVHQLHQHQN